MDESLRQLLDAVPVTAPRSKLEPHYEVIRELRRKRRTYAQIAHFLAEHLHVTVARTTIHAFVAVRARRKTMTVYELPSREAAKEKPPDRSDADIADPIEALRQRQPPAARRPRFEFHEGEELKLKDTPPQ